MLECSKFCVVRNLRVVLFSGEKTMNNKKTIMKKKKKNLPNLKYNCVKNSEVMKKPSHIRQVKKRPTIRGARNETAVTRRYFTRPF